MRRTGLIAATSACGASLLYFVIAGIASEAAPFAFWHPGLLAGIASLWATVNCSVHLALTADECPDCKALASKCDAAARKLAEAHEALATLRLPESSEP